jgi:putative ABC transport system permease protein
VFAANLNHLAATPQLYGWTWDFNATDTTSANNPCGGTDYGLSREPGLAAVAEVCSQNIEIDRRPVAALAFTSLRGSVIFPEVVTGRSPGSPDEVALGSATLRALGKVIGDTVQARGLGASHAYRIVGETVFPTFGQAQPLDDGALFTGGGFSPLFNNQIFSRYFVGRFAPGSSHAIAERGIAAIPQLTDLSGPTRPVEVVRLLQIAWFPLSLASLLGGMALLTVGSTLWTGVRRNHRQLAILKTLGFDRRQVRSTVAWQATVFATISLVVGIPSGLVVGRIAWIVVADGLGIETVSTVPTAALALIVLSTIGMFNLVAWLPARSAARLPPAQALRVE